MVFHFFKKLFNWTWFLHCCKYNEYLDGYIYIYIYCGPTFYTKIKKKFETHGTKLDFNCKILLDFLWTLALYIYIYILDMKFYIWLFGSQVLILSNFNPYACGITPQATKNFPKNLRNNLDPKFQSYSLLIFN